MKRLLNGSISGRVILALSSRTFESAKLSCTSPDRSCKRAACCGQIGNRSEFKVLVVLPCVCVGFPCSVLAGGAADIGTSGRLFEASTAQAPLFYLALRP